MARIKGTAILGLLKHVKESAGREQIAELIDGLPSADQETFGRPIQAGAWYPYDAYASLLSAVTRRFGGGRPDFPASLGRFAARLDVGTIFKILSVVVSPHRALHAAGMAWSRYCDTGRFGMVRIENGIAEGHLEGFPGISPEHERLLVGWIEGMGRGAGARDITVALVKSVHDGAPVSGYEIRWTE